MESASAVILEPDLSVTKSRKRRDLAEVLVGYALILIVIWTPRPWQKLPYFVAAAFIVAVVWRSFSGWKPLGLSRANVVRSLWVVGVALIAAALAVVMAIRLHTLHAPATPILFVAHFRGYLIFAFVQQFLLQGFFFSRMLRLTRSPTSGALAAATVFSLAHLPNPILTAVTFVWGLTACLLFLRYRNLYTLAIAHAILGISIAITVPGMIIHNMRVGLGYITYSPHPTEQLDHRNH